MIPEYWLKPYTGCWVALNVQPQCSILDTQYCITLFALIVEIETKRALELTHVICRVSIPVEKSRLGTSKFCFSKLPQRLTRKYSHVSSGSLKEYHLVNTYNLG